MPDNEDKITKYLIILLIVILLITGVLIGIYVYTSNKQNTSKIMQNTTKDLRNPTQTQSYVGFVQEIAKKDREIDGVKYTHVIGLLDKSGNSLPVWMNEAEFNSIKYFNNINGEHVAITENDIKGGQLLRVTRTKTLNNGINESIITVELI